MKIFEVEVGQAFIIIDEHIILFKGIELIRIENFENNKGMISAINPAYIFCTFKPQVEVELSTIERWTKSSKEIFRKREIERKEKEEKERIFKNDPYNWPKEKLIKTILEDRECRRKEDEKKEERDKSQMG